MLSEHVDAAMRDGVIILRNVFPEPMLKVLEAAIDREPEACLSVVRWNPAVVDAARNLIGDDLVDTGQRAANNGTETLYTAWHADAPWSADTVLPAWRFAVYFRDYAKASGGLAVVPGSHLGDWPPINNTAVALPSRRGDLVIWNLRLMHAAGADNNGLPKAEPRRALFFDFAKPCAEVQRYIDWRREQHVPQT